MRKLLIPFLLALLPGSGSVAFAQAPVITNLSSARQAPVVGQPLSVAVTATSGSPLTYAWSRNGQLIAGATTATFSLTTTTSRDSGWYHVTVSNASGSTASTAIFVNPVTAPALVLDWGQYYNNELSPLPTPPSGLTSVARIAASGGHTLALKGDGTVVAWGRPFEGQLAVPNGLTEVVAIATGWQHSLALRSNGTVTAWGANTAGESSVPAGLTNVVSISAGQSHSLALRSGGTVTSWGLNTSGQGNVPAGATSVVAIASGAQHNLALRSDGTVVAWGANTYGQTSVPAGLNGVVAIAAGFYHSLALRSNGTVAAWGRNDSGLITVPGSLANVSAIAAGADVSLALKTDGTVVGWGSNVWGQLSLPAGLNQVTDIAAGSQQAVALRSSIGDSAPVISVHPTSQPARLRQGLLLTVSASGSFLHYSWRRNGVVIPFTDRPTFGVVSVQETDAGTYDVVVSNHLGSVTSNRAIVSLSAAPVFTVQPASVVVAAGQPVTLTATAIGDAPIAYQWHKNNATILGATNPSYTLPSVSDADSGIYYVTATNAAGTNSSTAATVTLLSLPTFSQQPVSVTATAGQTVSFSVSVTANPGVTSYQWRKNGVTITGNPSAGTSTLVLANVATGDSGSYDVVVTSPAGSATSSAATLAFPSPPVITLQPSPITVNQGERATLSVGAVAFPAIATYQWRRDGTPVSSNASAQTATFVIAATSPGDAGTYDVVITNPLGSTISADARLTVRPRPTIIAQPSPASAVVGQAVSFTVAAQNADTYQWRKDGATILGNPSAATARLTLANVTLADRGDYDVVLANAAGSVTSIPVRLEVAAEAPSRLTNLSVLAALTSANDVMTVGMVIGGDGTLGEKAVLVRAGGPSLAPLNVPRVLEDPKLEFFRNPTLLAANDNWASAQMDELARVFSAVGAFAFTANTSRDAALYIPTTARADHSVRITSANGGTGTVIAEIYDATPAADFNATTPRLLNLSVLKRIDDGITVGFVIAGVAPKNVLVRAIGPSLSQFNVEGAAPDPKLELFDHTATSIATNDNWAGAATLAAAFQRVSAFPLNADSRDAAVTRQLAPGAYTVQITAAGGTGGVGLVEIYEVP